MKLNNIQKIQEDVYTYLLSTELPFIVRQRPTQKFEKGYWLLGNDWDVVTSFWEGRDWQNKTPNIFLNIYEDRIVLTFIANTEKEKEEKLEVLASLLKMNRVVRKSGNMPHWTKTYTLGEGQSNYVELIKRFIETDKKTIDIFLSQKETSVLFPPIKKEEFDKLIKIIELWRGKFKNNIKETKQKDISKTNGKENESFLIDTLDCENIGHFKKIENLIFNKRITCLIGENGSGKSTILKAVASAIATYDRNDKSHELNDALEYLLKLKGIGQNGNLEYEDKGFIKLQYGNSKNTNGLIFDKNDKDFIKDDESCNFEINDNSAANQTYKILVLGFSQARANGNSNGNSKTYELEKPNLEDIKSLINNESLDSIGGLEEWLMRLRATGLENQNKNKKEKTIREFEVIDKIIELINKIVGDPEHSELIKIKNYHPNKSFIALDIDGQEIPFRIMSQGFQNVFSWVGNMIKRMSEVYKESIDFTKEPCICLIDEIDTYLHPDWQYTILGMLGDYFPKTQFIVTTHSPYVLGSVRQEDITVYRFHKKVNDIEIEKIDENLYGASVEYLTTLMKSTRRNPDVTAKFKDLFKSIKVNNEKEASAIYSELSKIMDNEDPDLIKAQILMPQITSNL